MTTKDFEVCADILVELILVGKRHPRRTLKSKVLSEPFIGHLSSRYEGFDLMKFAAYVDKEVNIRLSPEEG